MKTLNASRPSRRDLLQPVLRWIPAAGCLLILCSCRPLGTTLNHSPVAGPPLPSPALSQMNGVPPGPYSGLPAARPGSPIVPAQNIVPVENARNIETTTPATAVQDAPFAPLPLGMPPGMPQTNWTPPGVAAPWPQDEFLADGGDLPPFAASSQNGVIGLNPEDAVAQYTSADGRTVVQPFNRAFIYSPRFAAVRQVVGVQQNDQAESTAGVHLPTHLAQREEMLEPGVGTQRYQPLGTTGRRGAGLFLSRQGDGAVSQSLDLRGFSDAFKPYENFRTIVSGTLDSEEIPTLSASVQAAMAWSSDQAVQIILDGTAAAEAVATTKLHAIYTVKSEQGEVKLRLIKVASTDAAQPGDFVDFTLRFDNVGTATIQRAVIIDNLGPRLEYEPDSAQASVDAAFSAQANEAGSSLLQWELDQPLKPGEGGIIRFRVKVR
ncbi:hypothetical protein [Thermopirellula anaerolimosa]